MLYNKQVNLESSNCVMKKAQKLAEFILAYLLISRDN